LETFVWRERLSTILIIIKAVRSWLNFNEVRLVRRIKIENRNLTPTTANRHVPTKDELRAILNIPKAKARCSISFIAFAG